MKKYVNNNNWNPEVGGLDNVSGNIERMCDADSPIGRDFFTIEHTIYAYSLIETED
jgi:hypothetical protein